MTTPGPRPEFELLAAARCLCRADPHNANEFVGAWERLCREVTRIDASHTLPVETGPMARLHDRSTSRRAAERIAANPTKLTDSQRMVLCAHAVHEDHGMTDFELAYYTGRKQTSVGKRRLELERAGLIEDSGERRPSDTNTPAIVWQITGEGKVVARGE